MVKGARAKDEGRGKYKRHAEKVLLIISGFSVVLGAGVPAPSVPETGPIEYGQSQIANTSVCRQKCTWLFCI